MITVARGYSLSDRIAAAMFEDRKRQFVDVLAWDVPVYDGRYEIDQFDGDDATYLIAVGQQQHLGSLRLLPTLRPHILRDLFPDLCEEGVPRGSAIMEITRLCLPTRLGTAGRLHVRNCLISAMVDHALTQGVSALTGVVTARFREQVLAMGWRAVPLGPPRAAGGAAIAAFRIDIDDHTPALLAATGIYQPGTLVGPRRQAA